MTNERIHNLTTSGAGKCRANVAEIAKREGDEEKERRRIVNETKDVVTHSSIAFSG